MRKILLTAVILALSINCISFAIDNNIQISDKDKKLYKLRQNQEYGMYAGDMSMYNKDYADKADSFLQKGNIEKANKYIDLALYYYDRNPLSYVIKAEIDLKNNNINGAKDNYRKAIDIIESDLDKYNSAKCNSLWVRIDKGYIKIALFENDTFTANDRFIKIKSYWNNFDNEVIRLYGKIVDGEKYYSNIADLLDNIDLKLKKQPNDADLYYLKALILWDKFQETNFAYYYVNKAIEIQKQSKYLLLKSQLVQDKEKQLNLINGAVKINPTGNPDVYIARADFYYDEENYENALQDYLKALNYGSKTEDYAEQIGWCYFELEEFEQSLKYFVISNNIGGQADSLLNLGRYKEALELYKQIIGNPAYNQDVVKSNMNACKKNLGK